jgi:hypothetical protein
MKYQ